MDDQVVATRREVASTLGLAPEALDKLVVGLLPPAPGGVKETFTFAELAMLRSLSQNEIRRKVERN